MSNYKDCQKLVNNFSNLKMDTRDDTVDDEGLSLSNASPPDFDFNIPCRFFKSSFARSLSLNSAINSQCKSLDYDISGNNNKNNGRPTYIKRAMTPASVVPPLPQKRLSQAGSFYQQNEANTASEQKQVFADTATANGQEKPPALPARRPLSLHNLTLSQNLNVNGCEMNAEQKFQQTVLTQLRQQAYNQTNNIPNNNSIKPVNGNNSNTSGCNSKNNSDQPTLNPKSLHHFTASSCKNVSSCSSCHSSSVNNNNNTNNFRRNINNNNNHLVWPNQQKNVEQDFNVCIYNQVDHDVDGDELNSNYHDAMKSSTVNEYNNHFHSSHQLLPIHRNQHQQQQNDQQYHQQEQHQQTQQQQEQHQVSSYEILNDTTTNVEAVILQNQVDTLQWQLKQMETSCDMYRAVMEEVARFLERYQSQKQLKQQQQQQQLQQQQQQQKQQQQQQMAAIQKHHNNKNNSNSNNHNKLDQIPRSKSLFQVYLAGGHEKSKNEKSNTLDDTSTSDSCLRARSSTNLVDLKHQQLTATCNSKSKDDHIYETGLTPSQSYGAFKDFTWRRSPKKSNSRLTDAKDDVEEKLNQEAFRLLRTIHNLLNTSQQHQPDLAHHRLSLAPAATTPNRRLSTAMSTTSVSTLPGPPMHNSTSLTIGASNTSDSTNTLPTIKTANNAATNNLAPEMLFLRSANVRDSRISLRSSTDSSVHSTSSATSSASSKLETDEDHSTPNMLTNKQQQHHHLNGSSTEDESGFSSISSFPEIGVPLSSTMLSSTTNNISRNRLVGKELKSPKTTEGDLPTADSRNSTLKANVVGLPLNSSPDMSHRWDSPSKTYHNARNKFQKFSALTNEDSNAVLWV